jgi:hypothetical protein
MEKLSARPDSTFVAQVVYAIPAMDELKRRFPAYVNPGYDRVVFEPITVCEKISRVAREVEFEYVHLGCDASNATALSEIDKRCLRPALPEELFGFDVKYPEEMKKHPIVALGSTVSIRGKRYVAYLLDDTHGRELCLFWVVRVWTGDNRFLAVREDAQT